MKRPILIAISIFLISGCVSTSPTLAPQIAQSDARDSLVEYATKVLVYADDFYTIDGRLAEVGRRAIETGDVSDLNATISTLNQICKALDEIVAPDSTRSIHMDIKRSCYYMVEGSSYLSSWIQLGGDNYKIAANDKINEATLLSKDAWPRLLQLLKENKIACSEVNFCDSSTQAVPQTNNLLLPTPQLLPSPLPSATHPPLNAWTPTPKFEQGFVPGWYLTKPTNNQCVDWREVTKANIGERMCVYGTASSYQVYGLEGGGTTRMITFSDGIKCLRTQNPQINEYQLEYRQSRDSTIVLIGDNLEGKCVLAYGVIRDDSVCEYKVIVIPEIPEWYCQ